MRRDEAVANPLQGDDGGNAPRSRRRLASLAKKVSDRVKPGARGGREVEGRLPLACLWAV